MTSHTVSRAENGKLQVDVSANGISILQLVGLIKKIQQDCETLETDRLNTADEKYSNENMIQMRERAINTNNWEKTENVALYCNPEDENKCCRSCDITIREIEYYNRLIGTKYYLCPKCYKKTIDHHSKLNHEKVTTDLEYIYDHDYDGSDAESNDDDESSDDEDE